METSLTVNEADKMLEELAAKGHLDVTVRGGGFFYGLWEHEAGRRELGRVVRCSRRNALMVSFRSRKGFRA